MATTSTSPTSTPIHERSHRLWMVGSCALLVVLCGCADWKRANDEATGFGGADTQSDVLRATYADLEEGRFAVLADFEFSGHTQLFRMEPVGSGSLEAAEGLGVAETGGTGLRAVFDVGKTVLIADNDNARRWVLKRDWRPYGLLLMNIFWEPCGGEPASGTQGAAGTADAQEVVLQLTVVSGKGEFISEAASLIPLTRGWNLVRVDLGDLGDVLALDDVRQIRWSIPDTSEGTDEASTVELVLDDLLLADNRVEVFGSAEGQAGSLYVAECGRRFVVGAVGRFELVFSKGQVVGWYDLGNDPLRARNLVPERMVLGPELQLLSDCEGKHAATGQDNLLAVLSDNQAVLARQRVTEANDVRMVVESDWSTGSLPEGLSSVAPSVNWKYTIYASGDVHVAVACQGLHDDTEGLCIGLGVNIADNGQVPVGVHRPGDREDRPTLQPLGYAWATTTAPDSGLLWVLHDSSMVTQLRAERRGGGASGTVAHIKLVAAGRASNLPSHRWHSLLNVWPAGNCGRQARRAAAVSYCYRPHAEFEVGSLDRSTEGDADGDGFCEEQGLFTLFTDSNRVQVRLDGRDRALVNPVFLVSGSEGMEAWVYVDYAILDRTARDSRDRLLFELPGVIDRETVLEVYLRRHQ